MTIKDPVLSPYQIQIDNNNHTVLKDTGRLTKENEPIFETIGYCSSMPSALSKIAKAKLLENNQKQSLMIRDYVSQLKEITESITKNINI